MHFPVPSPLTTTAPAFAAACKAAGRCSREVALEAYARFWRQGRVEGRGACAIPPIQRTHLSESDEGAVLKFTQRVPRSLAAAADPLAIVNPAEFYETESVLIPMVGRTRRRSYTLCVSSQVGCAMGCGFCQTAQMGLLRSLTTAEITAQWFAAEHLLLHPKSALAGLAPDSARTHAEALDRDATIGNIVFMGMGEPMDNLDAVISAIAVLADSRGPAIAMSRITVSTVGRIDGVERLSSHVRQPGWHRLGLAISLNAPTDQIRSQLMPINRAMPLADLRIALEGWPIHGGSHQCLEYVLIPGVNDAMEHADAAASFVQGREFDGAEGDVPRYPGPPLKAMVNIIPYNPRDNSPWPAPEEQTVLDFMQRVKSHGVYVKRRRTKGRDTMAACGQLGNPSLKRRPVRV